MSISVKEAMKILERAERKRNGKKRKSIEEEIIYFESRRIRREQGRHGALARDDDKRRQEMVRKLNPSIKLKSLTFDEIAAETGFGLNDEGTPCIRIVTDFRDPDIISGDPNRHTQPYVQHQQNQNNPALIADQDSDRTGQPDMMGFHNPPNQNAQEEQLIPDDVFNDYMSLLHDMSIFHA